jgi:shikimate dehydrogenase
MSDCYAVFGNPVAHSQSPRIHAAFAAQTGEEITYTARLVPLGEFPAAVQQFMAEGGKGANVTVPFKEEAFLLCTLAGNTLTPRARQAGAVNTLRFTNNSIAGDNTDGAGLVRDIEKNLGYPLADRRVLLLGAGGAARGVLAPLLECHPATLTIANRTAAKAEALAVEFGTSTTALQGGGFAALEGQTFDVLINATSASLENVALPLPKGVFGPGCLAYDMMYGKHETPFLAQAHAAGVAWRSDGLGMLLEQAAESFFVWRGMRPETRPLLKTLRGEYAAEESP